MEASVNGRLRVHEGAGLALPLVVAGGAHRGQGAAKTSGPLGRQLVIVCCVVCVVWLFVCPFGPRASRYPGAVPESRDASEGSLGAPASRESELKQLSGSKKERARRE